MKDTTKLLRALQKRAAQIYVPNHQVQMAAIIMRVNGIEAALNYVKDLPDGKPSIEAVFEFYLEESLRRLLIGRIPTQIP